MTRQVSAFIDQCRTRARAIKSRHEEIGPPVSLSQAYELLAASEGHRTWAAMRAAGETTHSVSVEPAMDDGDETSRSFFSIEIHRRISLDEASRFDVSALLISAHADLSYVYFDGEETPSMRFRSTLMGDDDVYSVIVDIERSPLRDEAWHSGRIEFADNVVLARPANSESATSMAGPGDAVFAGSGSRKRDLPWIEATPMAGFVP